MPELPTRLSPNRLAIVDLLRGVAAVFVAWHHLSLYAPQSDLADRVWPLFGFFLYNHALLAMAIAFFVALTVAHFFYEWIDKPAAQWLKSRRS